RLARQVASSGIRRVVGRVVGDDGYYDAVRGVRGWKPSFLGIECPPLAALSVRGLTLRGASSSAAAAAEAFTKSLARRGVVVTRAPRTGRAPTDVLRLAVAYSHPLTMIVQEMDRESDNFVAEMLLKGLGAEVVRRGSSAAGAAVVRSEL